MDFLPKFYNMHKVDCLDFDPLNTAAKAMMLCEDFVAKPSAKRVGMRALFITSIADKSFQL